MILTGFIGKDGTESAVGKICTMLSSMGKRVDLIELAGLVNVGRSLQQELAYLCEAGNPDCVMVCMQLGECSAETLDLQVFDILIFDDRLDELSDEDISVHARAIYNVLSRLAAEGTAIVNADCKGLLHLMQGMNKLVVTYGFNPKASVTASSIGDPLVSDSFLCCLQKTVLNCYGLLVEPQEFKIPLESYREPVHQVLAAATLAILSGIDPEQMNLLPAFH